MHDTAAESDSQTPTTKVGPAAGSASLSHTEDIKTNPSRPD